MTFRRGRRATLVAALALTAVPVAAAAPPAPIPEGPQAGALQRSSGAPVAQRPVEARPTRRGIRSWRRTARSNLHVDAYQTDVHQGPGPLGHDMARIETFLSADCALGHVRLARTGS